MSSRRVYSVYVGHIRDAAERAQRYTSGLTLDEFEANQQVIDATVRVLEIIGEATKRLPEDIRSLEPEIPWRKMAGLRDIVIHQYDHVDLAAVWAAAREDVPNVRNRLERLQYLLEQKEDEEWEQR